jgi:hypothetical protein
MSTMRRYDQVQVGDSVRDHSWSTFHEVVRVEQHFGLTCIEIGVGGLVESLNPRPGHELIETESKP